ncbi:MAG: ATP-binding protein [Gammaproteobacteria bacterium]|nr:ATP-binding protein [Gammaproteobacteria bacterium]
MIENHFPQGLAIGDSFIGREEQMAWLMKNINSGYHTLLLAPRRYGKTSLAINTLAQINIPYTEVNCYLALSASAVEKKIIIAVQSLLEKLISKPEKILTAIQSFFKKGEKRWTLGFKGVFGLEIVPDSNDDHPENILTALQLIEDVLEKQKKTAVMFIDEIQEISSLKESKQLGAAIRQFAQHSKRLVFIFSGSNRRMLIQMFDDSSMPLYELCDRIILDRIDTQSYECYLNKVAKKTFNKSLSKGTLQAIMQFSERHPKRIYNLCFHLWRLCENQNKTPDEAAVKTAWDLFLDQRVRDVQYHLRRLSAGQIKVLTLIAMDITKELSGQIAQAKVKLAGPSIIKALQVLEAGDYIEKDSQGVYRVLDPLIRDILVRDESVNLA